MAGDRERCLEAGMNDYVTKPIRPEELAAALLRAPARGRGSTPASTRDQRGPGTTSPEGADGPLDEGTFLAFVATVGGDEDPSFVDELIEQFLKDAPELVVTMRARLTEDDAEGVRRAAHTLKSNAATFGALGLAARCAALEASAKDRQLADAEASVDAIAHELDIAAGALRFIRTRHA